MDQICINILILSGEDAFWSLSRLFAWAKNPMIKRIHKMDPSLPMTVIYGKNSWMKHITLTEFIEARGVEDNTRVEVLYYSLIILNPKMIIFILVII